MEPPLLINQGTYHGRASEKEKLRKLFDQSLNECVYLTISGRSGSGKSSLIEAIPWEQENKCYFVSGKFELHQTNRPFSAITDALSDLVSKWSVEGASEIRDFCESATREEFILRQFLPNLYKLSGLEHSNAESKADNNNNIHKHNSEHLRMAVYKLLRCVVKLSRPVTIALDDIQWADQPSLSLIKFLVQENLKGLFIVVTYRSEEVDKKHPVTTHLDELSKEAAS
jgi:histidine kinase